MKQWLIIKLDTKEKEDTLTDVVICVHWKRKDIITIEDKTYIAEINGTMNCEKPSETDFTNYYDLTYDKICNWLDNGLNVEYLDSNLDEQIKNQINPPIINLPLPFSNPL